MARSTFGGFGGDQVSLDPAGNSGFYKAAANYPATGTFWSASTGGTQYTDLVDPTTSAALTGVSTDGHGHVVPFKGPDGITEGWLDFGGGRFKVTAVDSGIFLTQTAADGKYVSHGDLVFNVKDYGAKGNNSNDDTTSIQNAITAAVSAGGGLVWFPAGTYKVTSTLDLSTRTNIELAGTTRARSGGSTISWAGTDSGTTILLTNANGIRIIGLGFAAPSGTYTGVHVDGRGTTGTPQAFHITVQWCFFTDSSMLGTSIATGTGHDWQIAYNDFYRSKVAIKGSDLSASPQQAVQSVLVERNWFETLRGQAHITDPGAGWVINANAVEPLNSGAHGFIRLLAATPNLSQVTISNNWCGDSGAGVAGSSQIEVAGGPFLITGNLLLNNPTESSIKAVGAITSGSITDNRIDGSSSGYFMDWGSFTHTKVWLHNNSVPSLILDTGTAPTTQRWGLGSDSLFRLGSTRLPNNTSLRFRNVADSLEHLVYAATDDSLRIDAIADKGITLRLPGTGASSTLGAVSLQYWNGSAYVNALQVNNTGLILNAPRWALVRSTLAANGAVTVDASAGDAQITLQANATSTTITNPVDVRKLTITFRQDATGGHTYVWPANCLFAGGTAPSDTTANKQTSVTFRWDGFVSKWYEESRAVAVG
jgi:hypothetical protein